MSNSDAKNETNEFLMNKDGKRPIDGFVPEVIESIGYGTATAIDEDTKKPGLIPIPTHVKTGSGKQERIMDNPECYAKILKFEGGSGYVYYVRMNARGDVSDPWGLYSDSSQNAKIARHKGTSEYVFKKIHERAFISFLRYLANRNKSFLRLCERDIKDA